ncbi:MAG: hypothetical protein MJK04_15510, partial [Psychrosphaera sp.]|nr:hypothetical protein [Psychrosphaera sp.]
MLACVLSQAVFADHQSNDSKERRFTRLNQLSGLTQNSINDILQDQQGFIWVATLGGLHKFDGFKFKRMTFASSATTAVNKGGEIQRILKLYEDKKGKLWIGSNNGRVFVVNKVNGIITDLTLKLNPLAFVTKPDNQSGNDPVPNTFGGAVLSFYEDSKGRMWIGSNLGLAIFDTINNTVITQPQFKGGPPSWAGVTNILPDGNGKIWIGTSHGLFLVNPDNEQLVKSLVFDANDASSLSNRPIITLFVDQYAVWIGTLGDGLMRLKTTDWQLEKYRNMPLDDHSIGANTIRDILRDSKGRLWFATQAGGLAQYQPDSNDFVRHVKHKNNRFGLPNNNILSLFEDQSGVLWIGTAGSGVVQLVPSTDKFSVLESVPFDDNSISDDFVWNFALDSTGLLWIATLDGLNSYNPKTAKFEVYRFNQSQAGEMRTNQIISLDNFGQEGLWLGTPQGNVFQFSFTDHQFKPLVQPAFGNAFGNGRVWNIYQDKFDHMWISTPKGTYRLSPEQQRQALAGKTDFTPFTPMIVRVVYEDDLGRFWVGLHNRGLLVLAPDMALLEHITNDPMKESSLSHNTVRAISEDSFGNIW